MSQIEAEERRADEVVDKEERIEAGQREAGAENVDLDTSRVFGKGADEWNPDAKMGAWDFSGGVRPSSL